MELIFLEKVKENKEAFAAKVNEISKKLLINPNWLMFVMNSESGLNHRAVNPNGNATGLIQFMPATAIGLGTTVQALKNMSNVEQLDYVYKYFKPWTGRINSYVDLYMITFFPIAVGKSPDFVFETKNLSAAKIAQANPVFDLNKDGKITLAEASKAMLYRVPEKYHEILKKK